MNNKFGEITQETKEAAQKARQERIQWANENLDMDWGTDDDHWAVLAKKFNFRLPVRYMPNTETKYIKRLFKQVGIDIKEYLEDCGVTTLKRLNDMNPRESARASAGFALEWIDERLSEQD